MDLLLGVKDTLLLVDLGPDWDGRVDGVGNDTNVSVGAVLGTSESQISDDGSVGVLLSVFGLSHDQSGHTKRSSRLKHVSNITGQVTKHSRHTGLPWDTSGDDDELSTSQSLLDAIIVSQTLAEPRATHSSFS
jgi:hypothetical protein